MTGFHHRFKKAIEPASPLHFTLRLTSLSHLTTAIKNQMPKKAAASQFWHIPDLHNQKHLLKSLTQTKEEKSTCLKTGC